MRDRVVGALAVLRPGGASSFGSAETRLVEDLGRQAVAAIEQAQLFARVRADASELENSYDTTLKVLMAALDAKDNVTEGHCERVAKLTVQLAKFMNVPDASLVDIERGALLHDVGKIGVPDAVLNQPEKLNAMEWEAMRKHPLLAGVMVSKVGFLEKALPILLYHHERFDGTGYPFGLAADNIPLEARIFSIVDAYDAMTSDRPYRDAMSYEAAMAEIRENCGTQFDPNVVESFEQLMTLRPDLRDNTGHRMHDSHDEDLDPTLDDAGGHAREGDERQPAA
jgi:HD-GYP domain-containing protein (c-di-GMP phosphodiesterase class II)